eukprot:9495984-Pyramimonas_sp.AAC.2
MQGVLSSAAAAEKLCGDCAGLPKLPRRWEGECGDGEECWEGAEGGHACSMMALRGRRRDAGVGG